MASFGSTNGTMFPGGSPSLTREPPRPPRTEATLGRKQQAVDRPSGRRPCRPDGRPGAAKRPTLLHQGNKIQPGAGAALMRTMFVGLSAVPALCGSLAVAPAQVMGQGAVNQLNDSGVCSLTRDGKLPTWGTDDVMVSHPGIPRSSGAAIRPNHRASGVPYRGQGFRSLDRRRRCTAAAEGRARRRHRSEPALRLQPVSESVPRQPVSLCRGITS